MQREMAEKPLVGIDRQGDIAVTVIDRPPANALSQSFRAALVEALEALREDAAVRGVVIACAGRTFIAGAEISELGQPLEPSLPEVVALIEGLGKPTAAALHGTALGGGFEVALGCTFRVAKADAKVGFPEVRLGILPGAGGTVRTTRLAGAQTALRLAGTGQMIGAAEAQRLGLVDELTQGDPVGAAVALLRKRLTTGDLPQPLAERATPEAAPMETLDALCAQACKSLKSRAPERVRDAVATAQSAPFGEALARERALFLEAVTSPASAALRYLFFAERSAAKSGVDRSVKPREIARVGVIGAGTMGRGIAMAFANAGNEVALSDTAQEALDAAMAAIRESYDGLAARGKLSTGEAASRVQRITAGTGLDTMAECDLIVEAAFEDMGVKKEIFARLDALAKPDAILATNTSYLNVNEIAAATARPEDVVGLHFFSPAHIMKLLEIVRADKTADDVLQTACIVAQKLGKQAVTVGVCRGFVGNRMLQVRNRAVSDLLCAGAAPEQIDEAFRALGWPMGPCEMQDLAGLDIAWRIRKAEGLREPIADALCEAGRFGRKAGKGWYDYVGGRPQPSEEVLTVIDAVAAERGITRRTVTAQEIVARTHDPMIAEGKAILAEGLARSAADIDVIWVNGYGFPRERGGPMYWDANLRTGEEVR
jgi:3-hydroxyacyl-CoA dehydrogenase